MPEAFRMSGARNGNTVFERTGIQIEGPAFVSCGWEVQVEYQCSCLTISLSKYHP
jgi:hypothetical protein